MLSKRFFPFSCCSCYMPSSAPSPRHFFSYVHICRQDVFDVSPPPCFCFLPPLLPTLYTPHPRHPLKSLFNQSCLAMIEELGEDGVRDTGKKEQGDVRPCGYNLPPVLNGLICPHEFPKQSLLSNFSLPLLSKHITRQAPSALITET